jgi:hypothetical protein
VARFSRRVAYKDHVVMWAEDLSRTIDPRYEVGRSLERRDHTGRGDAALRGVPSPFWLARWR